ncbi:threonine aldolase family protein [Alkaliphilus peptidifermentans]|uniref:L-threonine aldolase n=1 Tax=Alkaliphilus peptidifermentans DSM 18978 TaxID=1120976 RepID=A0A1G5JU68_9FIRM|nr:low specificity L-threonine aldolase [Alkaliphilus peptidifermentans]SCY91461.1 L-threonine aldolase [Alkaliphilus peptidifermentans DSM 18978]
MAQLFEKENNLNMVYSFKNDYSEGAHPNILEALKNLNLVQQEGYGVDDYSKEAVDILRSKISNSNADIHFVSGGTQANLIVISSILKPYESVISATTGHINTHETGAIEATGHKVNGVDTKDGKLTPNDVKSVLEYHVDEHMVKPKLVYISNTTELGTIYKKNELEELSSFCKDNQLLLFLDGARLGSALTSQDNDLSLDELSRLVDAFYIGGTKNGALLGEAIVINKEELKTNFRYNLKQKGALLSKGRVLGVQFLELFKDDLFFDLAKHANIMATKLSTGIEGLGYSLLTKSVSNQIFPILPDTIIDKLSKKYLFYVWCKSGNAMSIIRLVTSWATKEEAIESFINDLEALK